MSNVELGAAIGADPTRAAMPPAATAPQQATAAHPDSVTASSPATSFSHLDSVPHSQPSTADSNSTAAPTATIDPNVPSSASAPTALPTNATTHPAEQREAIKKEHPAVIGREVEKTKAAEREVKGEPAGGTVVKGIEDDRLYAMLRRFDQVSTARPSDAIIPS